MAFPSKFQFVLLILYAIVVVSQAGGWESFSLLAPQAKDVVTCPVPQNQCGLECARRCSATSHQKPCLLYCNQCCNKCLCVPSGTYGNKECCPCYNNWKTQEGGPKCP